LPRYQGYAGVVRRRAAQIDGRVARGEKVTRSRVRDGNAGGNRVIGNRAGICPPVAGGIVGVGDNRAVAVIHVCQAIETII